LSIGADHLAESERAGTPLKVGQFGRLLSALFWRCNHQAFKTPDHSWRIVLVYLRDTIKMTAESHLMCYFLLNSWVINLPSCEEPSASGSLDQCSQCAFNPPSQFQHNPFKFVASGCPRRFSRDSAGKYLVFHDLHMITN
jgi:hypothetical protein